MLCRVRLTRLRGTMTLTVQPQDPYPTPLACLVEDYLNHCRAGGLSAATLDRSYSLSLHKIFLPWCEREGIRDVPDLDARATDRYTAELLTRPKARGGRLSKESVRAYVRPVRQFLSWAASQGETVLAQPRLPKVGKRQRDVLSRDEIDLLEASAPAERDKLVIRILGDCGLRLSEVTGLRARDIITNGNRAYLHVRGKGDRERRVPIPPRLLLRVRRHIDGRPKDCSTDRLFLGLRRGPSGEYEPIMEAGVAQLVHAAAQRSGLTKRIHPHLFRHSWMTEMLRRGMNPIQLSVIAGACQEVIAEHYQHLTQDDAYEAMIAALVVRR